MGGLVEIMLLCTKKISARSGGADDARVDLDLTGLKSKENG